MNSAFSKCFPEYKQSHIDYFFKDVDRNLFSRLDNFMGMVLLKKDIVDMEVEFYNGFHCVFSLPIADGKKTLRLQLFLCEHTRRIYVSIYCFGELNLLKAQFHKEEQVMNSIKYKLEEMGMYIPSKYRARVSLDYDFKYNLNNCERIEKIFNLILTKSLVI